MNKLAILALPLLLIFSGKIYAETTAKEAEVKDFRPCSTLVLTNKETKAFELSTTTCPNSDNTPGTVSKTFADGTTIVLQNGQIINLNK